MKKMYKTSTAMVLALSLAAPAPVFAQSTLDVLRSGAAGPNDRPVCSDGTLPVCGGGEAVLTFGEMVSLVNSGSDAGIALMTTLEGNPAAAFCSDGAVAACDAGAEMLVPGNADYDQAAAMAAQAATAEPGAPEVAEEASTEEVAPEAVVVEDVPATEAATETPEVAAETEVPVESETDAAALAAALAAEAAAEAEAAPEPAPEPAPEAEVEAEVVVEAEPEVEEEAVVEAEPAAEAAPMVEAAAEAEVPDQGEARMEAAEAAAANPEGNVVMGGAEGREEEAMQVLEAIGAIGEASEGESGERSAAAAAAEGEVDTANTTEVMLTEDDTRRSDEDFATTASGKASAQASGDDGGMSDFEKAALVGLGILAVGALLKNGDRVVSNTGDRVVVQRGDNDYYVLKDDDTLLRQPGANVRTETFDDGSTRSTVTREDGSRIITIRDASGRVLRRVRENEDGSRIVLIDDTETYEAVEVETLPEPSQRIVVIERTDPESVREALERASARNVGRAFSLRQIRDIERVRKLVPEIALDEVNFETGSSAIRPSEAEELTRLGDLMRLLIEDNPGEMFLVEGHTDATGRGSINLALSDRRAESVALALTEYFDVPPENMVVQGYGESDLKIPTLESERENRRVSVRRITPLLIDRVAFR